MKKLRVIFIAILLSGCVVDTSATEDIKPLPSFQFNEDELYIEINQKAVKDYFISDHLYTIYTTSEQAAYLLSGITQFSIKLNNVAVEEIKLTIGEKMEVNNDTIYELMVNFYNTSEQIKKIGSSITSLNISYQDQPIINFNHSPIYITNNLYEFKLIGGYKEDEEDAPSLGLENNSPENLSIQQLYIEGSNNKRFVIRDEPILFKQRETIKFPLNRKLLEQEHIEGAMGIFALLEDGREMFLAKMPFNIENYKDQMIEKLIQSIEGE